MDIRHFLSDQTAFACLIISDVNLLHMTSNQAWRHKFAGEINQFLRINFKSFVSAFLGIPVGLSHGFFLTSHGFGFACKCVYVIKCIKCDVFYIGETGTPIRVRTCTCMNSHLTEIRSGTSIVVLFPLTMPNFIRTSRRPLPRRAIRGDNSDQ